MKTENKLNVNADATTWRTATRAKSFTPRRSRTSVRFSLPSPKQRGHSMASVGIDNWVVMRSPRFSSSVGTPLGRQRNLTTKCREVSKVGAVGEAAVRLLLAPDQETGIRRIDGHQVSVPVTSGVETLAGAPGDLVLFVTDNRRCVAVPTGDGPNDPPFAVSHILLFE